MAAHSLVVFRVVHLVFLAGAGDKAFKHTAHAEVMGANSHAFRAGGRPNLTPGVGAFARAIAQGIVLDSLPAILWPGEIAAV